MRKIASNQRILQILLFGMLAYLLPLGCICLMKHTALGQTDIVHLMLFGLEAASPTIAAVITVAFFERKAGIKSFFCSNFSPRLKMSAAFACVIIAFAIVFTAKIISCLLLKTPFEMAELTSRQLIIIAWAFVAEEIGWRGFLTKKLAATMHQMLVPLLVGLIWAFWHYHFFILGTLDVAGPLFVAGCIADSYLYAALLKIANGNILIAMGFHLTSNLLINLFINPSVNGASAVAYAVYVAVSAIFAIGITAAIKLRERRNTQFACS